MLANLHNGGGSIGLSTSSLRSSPPRTPSMQSSGGSSSPILSPFITHYNPPSTTSTSSQYPCPSLTQVHMSTSPIGTQTQIQSQSGVPSPNSSNIVGSSNNAVDQQVSKPRREHILEFLKLVKDGKINEVNQALKSTQQFALCCDEKQNNALYYAAALGDKQMSDILINSGSIINHSGDMGSTPLMAAAEKGFAQCCELYIKCGANVNASNLNGNRALHLAASRGHHEVCRVLIENGAEISATNRKNLNAINEARAAQHYNLSDYLQQQLTQRMSNENGQNNTNSNSSNHHNHQQSISRSNINNSPPSGGRLNNRNSLNLSDLRYPHGYSHSSAKDSPSSFVSSDISSSLTGRNGAIPNAQSPFIGFAIGDLIDRKGQKSNNSPESNPFYFDLPNSRQSFATGDSIVDKAPGGPSSNSIDAKLSNSSSLTNQNQEIDSLTRQRKQIYNSLNLGSSIFSSLDDQSNSVLSTCSSQLFPNSGSSIFTSSDLASGLSSILSNATKTGNSGGSSANSGFSSSVVSTESNSQNHFSATSKRHSTPVTNFSSLRNNVSTILNSNSSMMSPSSLDLNNNSKNPMHQSFNSVSLGSSYSNSLPGFAKSASQSQTALNLIDSVNNNSFAVGSMGLSNQTLIELHHLLDNPMGRKHQSAGIQNSSSTQNLIQQMIAASTSGNFGGSGVGSLTTGGSLTAGSPGQGHDSSPNRISPTSGNGSNLHFGLKHQQHNQQIQMETLQYQLVINELARKNKELELRLSEMEGQMFRLQVENQHMLSWIQTNHANHRNNVSF